MSYTLLDSICLINSLSPEQHRSFGTGFIVYRHEQISCVLTCAHVVEAIGSQEEIKVDGLFASVVASGQEVGIDLAVLQVRDLPASKQEFKLQSPRSEGQPVLISGFYEFDKRPRGRELTGTLGDSTILPICNGRDSIRLWDLKIQQGDFLLRDGYSGSPVIDKHKGHVVGVASHSLNNGAMGAVISIDALQKFWTAIPLSLIESLTVPMFPSSQPPYQITKEPFKIARLKDKKSREEDSYERLSKKLKFFQESYDTTNDTAKKYDLETQIKKLESELETIGDKIQELESELLQLQ